MEHYLCRECQDYRIPGKCEECERTGYQAKKDRVEQEEWEEKQKWLSFEIKKRNGTLYSI